MNFKKELFSLIALCFISVSINAQSLLLSCKLETRRTTEDGGKIHLSENITLAKAEVNGTFIFVGEGETIDILGTNDKKMADVVSDSSNSGRYDVVFRNRNNKEKSEFTFKLDRVNGNFSFKKTTENSKDEYFAVGICSVATKKF